MGCKLIEGRANVKGELDNPAADTLINIENVDISGPINITLTGDDNDNQLYTIVMTP